MSFFINVGARHRIRIRHQRNGHLGRQPEDWAWNRLRRRRIEAVGVEDTVLGAAVVEEIDVSGADRDVVCARTAHHRLMVVIGNGVFHGEPLQDRRIALVHVEEGHRSAHAFFRLSGEGGDHVRQKIGKTTGRIFRRRVRNAASGGARGRILTPGRSRRA